MCSYKCWVWLTAIYSIPLILVLILGDVISLVGLNAPHLFQYTVPSTAPATAYLATDHLQYQNDEPRLGEPAALRMAYESQFVRNLDGDNELANEEIQEITTKPTESAASSDEMTSSDQTSSETTSGSDSTTESLNKENPETSQSTSEASKEPSETSKASSELSTESSASSSSEASTEPSQPSSEPGESSKASSESPTGSSESSTEPREPSTASSESSKASSESPSEPSEPSKPSSESSTEPSEPSKPSSESSTEPSEPSRPSSESSTEPSVGSSAPDEPSKAPSEPSRAPSESTKAPVEPSKAPTESTKAPSEPSKAPRVPTKATSAPSRRPSLSSRRPSDPSPDDGGRGLTDRSKEGTTPDGTSSPFAKRQTDGLTSTTVGDKGELEPDDGKEDPNPEKPDDTQDKPDGSGEKPDGSGGKPEEPQGSREEHRSEVLKRSWNLFLDGIYANDRRVLLNVFVIIKICFRVLSLVTLPLLIIGNQKSRSTYVKPFKILLLLQFLFAIGITAYYAIAATECDYYKNIGDWLPRHFDDPTSETGKNVARLYLLLTFADLFPYFCIVSLILINKRDRQINRRKEESQQENWNIQLNPISLPRIKNTANSEHISPLNLHFNQTANDNLPMTAGLITNEEISVNNQPFSYTSNSNHQQSSSQGLPCYDNHAFSKN